jgi:hypothetical protein
MIGIHFRVETAICNGNRRASYVLIPSANDDRDLGSMPLLLGLLATPVDLGMVAKTAVGSLNDFPPDRLPISEPLTI